MFRGLTGGRRCGPIIEPMANLLASQVDHEICKQPPIALSTLANSSRSLAPFQLRRLLSPELPSVFTNVDDLGPATLREAQVADDEVIEWMQRIENENVIRDRPGMHLSYPSLLNDARSLVLLRQLAAERNSHG